MSFVSSAHKLPVSESFIGVEGYGQKRLAFIPSGAELPKDVGGLTISEMPQPGVTSRLLA
jgi:hypothetical protein